MSAWAALLLLSALGVAWGLARYLVVLLYEWREDRTRDWEQGNYGRRASDKHRTESAKK